MTGEGEPEVVLLAAQTASRRHTVSEQQQQAQSRLSPRRCFSERNVSSRLYAFHVGPLRTASDGNGRRVKSVKVPSVTSSLPSVALL